MKDTRKSESGLLTYDEYRDLVIQQCPEIAQVDPSSKTFSIMAHWNIGDPVGFCVYAFKKNKEYRKIQYKNRKKKSAEPLPMPSVPKKNIEDVIPNVKKGSNIVNVPDYRLTQDMYPPFSP